MLPLLLLLLLIPAGTYLTYRFSSAYRAKQRIHAALSSYEAVDGESLGQKQTLRGDLEQSAIHYLEQTHRARLMAIPLDALKKYAAGLRLQALKDVGIRSIADLQGWNEYRIAQVRGVGPKSAGPIAHAVAAITAASKAEPVLHPAPPFSDDTGRQFIHALYRLRWFDSHLRQKGEAFHEHLTSRQTVRDEVVLGTSFSRWLWKFGTNTTIRKNVAQADALIEELEGTESTSMREALSTGLSELQTICSGRVAEETIIADFSENYEFYDSWLTNHLGVSPRRPSAAVMSPATPVKFVPSSSLPDKAVDNSMAAGPVAIPPSTPSASRNSNALVSFHVAEDSQPREFSLPHTEPRTQARQAVWIPKGKALQIQGRTLPRGLVYFGKGVDTEQDYVLNPWLSAKSDGSDSAEPQSYAPGYARLTPHQRGRYLDWLAEGAASASDAAFGTMYFYGLERRLLEWVQRPPASGSPLEKDDLREEVDRLGNLFRHRIGGVADCCERLLDFAAAFALDGTAPVDPPAFHGKGMELPFLLRYGIGCMMRDGKPIPLNWALRWIYCEPTIYLRTPAMRCPEAFETAFAVAYREKFGEGIVIRPNKTCLKVRYQPGWPTHFGPEIRKEFLSIPDVAAITGPLQTLKGVVEQSTTVIESYSRYLGRNSTKAGTLEGLLHLPSHLWSATDLDHWQSFLTAMVLPVQPTPLIEVLRALGETGDPALAKTSEIVANLSRARVGCEPDILSGARRPKPEESIVLFPLTTDTEPDRTSQDFKRASMTVALSACFALADGHASEDEARAVEAMISAWKHLPEDSRTRLRAQYRLQVVQGVSLASMKSRFSMLTPEGKMQMAQALSTLASVDGNIAAAEVKLLEQVYRALDLEPYLLYSHLHGGNRPVPAMTYPGSPSTAYSIDAARLVALRQETEQVNALLAGVFQDNETLSPVKPAEAPSAQSREHLLPGLDAALERFLQELLQKPSWTRNELEGMAAGMQIMLDGALEHINEAAFDFQGEPLTEGDDPIYVQQTILENAEQ